MKRLEIFIAFLLIITKAYAEPMKIDGSDITWEVVSDDSTCTLIIAGEGDMDDLSNNTYPLMSNYNKYPWKSVARRIDKIIVKEGITSIAPCAFQKFIKLKQVELPSTLSSIGRLSFSDCKNLTQLNIPESVEFIGDHAFDHTKIVELTIPPLIKHIPRGLCFGCENLQKVRLHDQIESIGESAFYKCPITLDTLKLPSALRRIDDHAYNGSTCSYVTFPDSLVYIGNQVFESCKFKSINVSSSVQYIGADALGACDSLQKLSFHWQDLDDTDIAYSMFIDDKVNRKIDVSIPINTKEHYEKYFQKGIPLECNYLEKNKPNKDEEILRISYDSITQKMIVNGPEYWNKSLMMRYQSEFLGKKIKTLEFGEGIRYIGCLDGEFDTITNGIEQIVIPSTVDYIHYYIIGDFRHLKNIDVSTSNIHYFSYRGSLYEGSEEYLRIDDAYHPRLLFLSDFSLTSGTYQLLRTVKSIAPFAFSNCVSLKKLIIDHYVDFCDFALSRCDSLETLDCSQSPIGGFRMSKGLFANSVKINDLNLNKFTSIAYRAFYQCYGLTQIRIPCCIKEISSSVFSNCYNLKDIWFGWKSFDGKQISSSAFHELKTSKITLHVPKGYGKLYKQKFNKEFKCSFKIVEY